MDETGVLGLLEELSILLEDSKPVFGKGNLRQVDIAAAFEIMDEIRDTFPSEFSQARQIVRERQSLLDDAEAEANRMIEDARYLGTESFPDIVEQTAFDKAQAIKFDRNTQKDIDRTAEIRTLPVPVCCATCGVPMRRLHDSRTSHQEKWVCQSCGTAIKITDTDLLSAITDRLNELIADPEQVHYTPATH